MNTTKMLDDKLTIAYITGLYARATDTFIRDEIYRLRQKGHRIYTFSTGCPDISQCINEEIKLERERTCYLTRDRLFPALLAFFLFLIQHPLKLIKCFLLAIKTSRSDLIAVFETGINLLQACDLAYQVNHLGIQQIHNHLGQNSATVAMLAEELTNVPVSHSIHGPYIFDDPIGWCLSEKIARASFIRCISYFTQSQCMRYCEKKHWHKLHVVRCVPSQSFFNRDVLKPSLQNRFLWIGRMCPEKGVFTLIEAFAHLAKQIPQIELDLVGDGLLYEEVKLIISKTACGDRIHLYGWLSSEQILERIEMAKAIVMASYAEGLPVVLMEAMALGRPVIASAIAGIPELVINEYNGWLVPASSVKDLVNALEKVANLSYKELVKMGKNASATVQTHHNPIDEIKILETLLRNV